MQNNRWCRLFGARVDGRDGRWGGETLSRIVAIIPVENTLEKAVQPLVAYMSGILTPHVVTFIKSEMLFL